MIVASFVCECICHIQVEDVPVELFGNLFTICNSMFAKQPGDDRMCFGKSIFWDISLDSKGWYHVVFEFIAFWSGCRVHGGSF